MSTSYNIAIYMRLSKEDEYLQDESTSITHQRLMLMNYIEHNFTNYQVTEFWDDGFTGTNFLRPGIRALLDNVYKGCYECVIVKDFSRFSRDYIELGSYLDQIFPFLGVRFISLNDGYDSEDYKGTTAELGTSFAGLLYDLYTKDLSVKVKSALRIRKEQGQFASAHCPFGYKKDNEDHHKIMIAEEEAVIVRKIFLLAEEGKTSSEIAKILNVEGIKTPVEFRIAKGETKREPKGCCFQWGISTICNILKNRFYVGDMEYGKYEQDAVGGKTHIKPRSQWKIYPEHHPPIIKKELFERIQKGRSPKKSNTKSPQGAKHPLIGKVICGCCKKSMVFRKNCLNQYFYCSSRYHNKDAENCVENINATFLENVILYQLEKEMARQENLRQEWKQAISNRRDTLMEEKEKYLKERKRIKAKRFEEYEKYALGKSDSFQTIDFDVKKTEEKIAEIEDEIEIQKVSQPVITELTKSIVEQMICRIIVYDERHIEVEWKFGMGNCNR